MTYYFLKLGITCLKKCKQTFFNKHFRINLSNFSKKMLRNCILPVNYTKTQTQSCGEIICENLQQFIINCKLCKIKIFEFEEFVEHFKKVHLDGKITANKATKTKQETEVPEQESYENIVKLEITPDVEESNSPEANEKDDDDFEWNTNDNDEDNDYEPTTDEEEDKEDNEEEETSKTVLAKVYFI